MHIYIWLIFSVTSTTTTTTRAVAAVTAPATATSANAQGIDRREHIFGVIKRNQLKRMTVDQIVAQKQINYFHQVRTALDQFNDLYVARKLYTKKKKKKKTNKKKSYRWQNKQIE